VARLVSGLGLSEPMARVLAGRGIDDTAAAERYLQPRLNQLPDPGRLAGIEAAVSRLRAALSSGETVGVFGDYDVDGVTSTTLLWDFLEKAGGEVVATIPDRLKEGYGLSRAGVERLRDAGATLIVTVDCGITAHEEVEQCAALGIDVIVIDHHTVPVTLPRAVAVINPHREDCDTGAEHLCAVGVTFNLVSALRRALRADGWFSDTRPEPDLRDALDLVALGTVADVVPLVAENRVFVSYGLQSVARAHRVGMSALLDVAGVDPARMRASALGYQLGPRINAAGRLGDAMQAVELLRTHDRAKARELASLLDKENVSRRDLERRIVDEAIEEIEASASHAEARVLVVGREEWHPGVVGIVASRLVDRFGKPAVVVGEGGRGSGRSISRYHLHEGLQAVSDTLEGFGGHAHAAGVRVAPEGLSRFRDALCAQAAGVLEEEDLVKVHLHDGAVDVDEVDEAFCEALSAGAPWGRSNPEPAFRVDAVHPRALRELKGGHFKAIVHPERKVEAICFGQGERIDEFSGSVDLLAVPEINEWRGGRTVQLRVRDFRASGDP
jgi:single-stranded-DNA-specific exonuclease